MSLDTSELQQRFALPFGAYQTGPLAKSLTRNLRAGRQGTINRVRRALAKQYFRRTGHITDVEYRSLKLRLMPMENACDMQISLFGAHPEEAEFAAFEAQLDSARTVVDIGANIGLYTILAALRLRDTGRILAFEPHPRTVIKLRTNVAFNDVSNVEVIHKAVGAEAGTLPMQTVSWRDAGRNSLVAALNTKSLPTVDVDVVPLLDELTARHVSQIDLLKIDVEGFEDQALMPFFDTAPRSMWPRYLMIEVAHASYWTRDVIAELTALGYDIAFENEFNRHLSLPETVQ